MSDMDECNNTPTTPRKKGFQKGNPGRPRGSRNHATILAERRLSKDIKAIAEVVTKAAKEGDLTAARLCIERVVPPAKQRLVTFQMPEIRSIDDIAGAMQALWTAVSTGAIGIDEMLALTAVLERHSEIVHASELEKRITALEGVKTKQLEYRNQP
jgi:hypothetical protein